MKKFLALALVVAFAITFVPATLAAPAEKFEKTANKSMEPALTQTAIDNNGNVVEVTDMRSDAKAISTDDVSAQYQTLKASDLQTKAGWQESPNIGVEMMNQEDTFLSGYWFDQERYLITNDWYTDQREVYTQIISPIEDSDYYAYEEGETVWFNYDLYQRYDQGSQELVPLPLDANNKYSYSVNCYLYAGTYSDFTEGDGIKMSYAWMSGYGGVSCKVTAPEDDYVYMFVFVLADTTLTEFGAWMSISYTDYLFTEIPEGEKMEVGKAVSTDLTGTGADKLVLAPLQGTYVLTYGAKHAIELEGGKNYVATLDSPDSIGAHVLFCDENMDVINETWIGSGALSSISYSDVSMIVMPAVSGTYYMVVCGFYSGDAGIIDVTVSDWNDVAEPIVDVNVTIDLDTLGTENYIHEVGGVQVWGYFWYAESGAGELLIVYPGTYTVKGDNQNIFCDIYDGVELILDNATLGSVWSGGTYASSVISAKGSATITDSMIGYTIYNYEGCNAGLYILGDNLTVEGLIASIVMESAPLHIGTKKLSVSTMGQQGYYPIAVWVTGKDNPQLTLAGEAKFDGSNQLATMYYDGSGYFVFGYTVSEYAELYRLNSDPDLNAASLSFELTTNGQFTGGAAGLLGDANEDGKVNTGDATAILKHVAQMSVLTGTGLANADMNQDGRVNTGDATAVLKQVAGM